MNKEILEHAERVHEDFCDELLDPEVFTVDLDPYTTEEKVIMAAEEQGLAPFEIGELALKALGRLPEFDSADQRDQAFKVLYETISEAVNRYED